MKFESLEQREEMILPLQGMIASIAWKAIHDRNLSGLDLIQDLVQEGLLAANKALDRFDPYKGVLFSTYAYYDIFHAVHVYLNREFNEMVHTVSDSDLEDFQSKNDTDTNNDALENLFSYEEDYDAIDRKEILKELLSTLNEQEQFIICHTYGVLGFEEMSVKEISQLLQCSESNVYKCTERALNKLRKRARI